MTLKRNEKRQSRRNFLINSAKLVGVAGAWSLLTSAEGAGTKKSSYSHSFKIGMAGYSFINFNIDQTLGMMKRINVNFLCIKDFHLPYDSSDAQIEEFLTKLQEAGITGYAVGPIGDEIDIDKAFDYAHRVGVKLITGIPALKDITAINMKVKQYDICYAIHNHGPDEKRYTDAGTVYNLIKDLDTRIGLCFDIGHNMRYGSDPVADMEKFSHRIFDIHLKNVTAASEEGRACELGRGVIDIPAFIKTLHKVNYSGCCSIEYEKDMEDPLPGIAESLGYYKGVCDGLTI